MKTLGILTTFRQPNFGSVLQAYALQCVVERLGYDTKIIDYKYPNEYHWKQGHRWGNPHLSLRWRLGIIKRRILVALGLKRKNKMEMMNEFISEYFHCTNYISSRDKLKNNPPLFDIYMSGSDQIWNPNTMYGDMSYMFDFAPKTAKRVAYSSSFSCDSIPSKYRDDYVKWLSLFSSIGVRESNGVKIAKDLVPSKRVSLVLDPTLLLNKEDWHRLALKSKKVELPQKYILFYMLAYTYSPEKKMGEILQFVYEKYNMPVVSLSPRPSAFKGDFIRIEDDFEIGNHEFIMLFEKAEMVVTSSFHGTAFSLNLGKPLLALENGKSHSDDRISSLLCEVGLKSQLVTTDMNLNDDLTPYYNVEKEQKNLQILRDKSVTFIKGSLN